MKAAAFFLMMILSFSSFSQDRSETRELVGSVGGRSALLVLQATQRPDGGWQVSGEYLLLPTLVRRYVEGERSPEIGVTTLKEGTTPILFGRPPTGELRGTWRGAKFSGMRYGPGGQERERFDFSEEFPPLDGYSGAARCEAGEGRYKSSLSYSIESGKLKSFEWRSQVEPGNHSCGIESLNQEPMKGGVRGTSRRCSVTFRNLGDFVRVAAENCSALCGSQAYLEPVLVDRRGNCRLLYPEAR